MCHSIRLSTLLIEFLHGPWLLAISDVPVGGWDSDDECGGSDDDDDDDDDDGNVCWAALPIT